MEDILIENFSVLEGSRFKSKGKYYLKLRCNSCGAVEERRIDQLKICNNIRCNNCLTEKYKKSLSSRGIDYLSRKGGHMNVKCRGCGNEWSVQLTHYKSCYCRKCVEIKYSKALSERGCTFIRHFTGKHGATGNIVEYINSSDEVRQVQTGHLLEGSWDSGDKIEDTYSVYLFSFIEDSRFVFKIGMSKRPEVRAKVLKLKHGHLINILYSSLNQTSALKIENQLHKHFSNMKLHEDYVFAYSKSIKKSKSDSRYIVDGATEWFMCESESDFMEAFNEFKKEHDCSVHSYQ